MPAGELVAFSGTIAHKADVGARVAGSTSANATEMFQEGLLLPAIKIVDGARRADRYRAHHPRQQPTAGPGWRRHPRPDRSDADGRGASPELCSRFGAATVTDAFAAILKGAADELRAAIAKLPEGEASAEGLLDSDGVVLDQPIKLAVTVAIKEWGRELRLLEQRSAGPRPGQPAPVDGGSLRVLLAHRLPRPEPAFQRRHARRGAAHLRAAHGRPTPRRPHPVSNYQMVNLKLVDVILEALAHFHPARAIANAGSSSALTIAWAKGRPGQSNMQYEIMGSAYGGGMGHDGASATATHLSNLHITPIEILESEFPLPHHALRPGAGFRRRRPVARRTEPRARIRAARGRDRHSPLRQEPFSTQGRRRGQGRARRALRDQARHRAGICDAVIGPLRAERRASASCCRAREAAAAASRRRATAPHSTAISPRDISRPRRRRKEYGR